MLKAILRNGVIVPLEPMPPEWEEGATLEVEKVNGTGQDIDAWLALMERLCADSPPEEEVRMQTAIEEHRSQAKAQARRDMGLTE
jgi:hypothetical protein